MNTIKVSLKRFFRWHWMNNPEFIKKMKEHIADENRKKVYIDFHYSNSFISRELSRERVAEIIQEFEEKQ